MQVPFYDRATEIKEMNVLLHGKPVLTVMLGPPSSGKTALMKHVLQLSRQDGPPLYHHLSFDLRLVDVTSESGFLTEFLRDGMLSNLKEYFEGLEISVSPSEVLEIQAERLKPLSLIHGNRPCVLKNLRLLN